MTASRKSVTKVIQEAIDRGATTVEEIHKSVADLPLKVLEERPLLKGPAKEVRRVQDRTIGAVYDLVREINQQVGNLHPAPRGTRRSSRVKGARPVS